MTLKAVLENLDDVEEAQRGLYKQFSIKEPDGKDRQVFALDIEGGDSLPFVAPLRNAHERQKAENQQLRGKIGELEAKVGIFPDDFTEEEWDRLKALDAEVKKQQEQDPEKKKQHEAEVQSIKQMHEQQIQRIKAKAEKDLAEERAAHVQTKAALRARVVGDDLTRALIENGIDKRYLRGAQALLERSLKVKEENGKMIAVVETDLGETPINEFVPQWVQSEEGKLYVPPARGSDAPGSGSGSKGSLDNNPWTAQHWNTTAQGQVYKADQARATRLAQAAGHAGPIGAHIENAKDATLDLIKLKSRPRTPQLRPAA